jgi:hypothetical protein
MMEPFAWSSGMAIVLIANPLQQPLCNGLVKGTDKGFYLFCKLVQPLPSSLQLPSLCHRHCSCRPCHRTYPPLQPLLRLPLPSLSPLPLLAHQACHCLHCLATLTLFVLIAATVIAATIALVVAHPAPSSPLPLLLPPLSSPSSLLATLIAITIALFIASAFTCLPPSLPLRCLGWGRGGPYQSGARSYFGRHHWCHHHCPCLCHPSQPAGKGQSNNAWDSNAWQTACANVARLLLAFV